MVYLGTHKPLLGNPRVNRDTLVRPASRPRHTSPLPSPVTLSSLTTDHPQTQPANTDYLNLNKLTNLAKLFFFFFFLQNISSSRVSDLIGILLVLYVNPPILWMNSVYLMLGRWLELIQIQILRVDQLPMIYESQIISRHLQSSMDTQHSVTSVRW